MFHKDYKVKISVLVLMRVGKITQLLRGVSQALNSENKGLMNVPTML
jgi:hypothetical protein